jgi:hypothetical protein
MNEETTIRPYNNSIFNLRQHYLTTFPEEGFARMPDADDVGGAPAKEKNIDSSKIYKINYSINLLPHVCSYITIISDGNGEKKKMKVNPDVNVMELLTQSDEYDIFNSQPVLDLIEFKWVNIGLYFHLIGFVNQMIFLVLLIIYNVGVYINDDLYEYIETDDPDYSHIGGLIRVTKTGNPNNQGNYQALILLVGLIYPFVYFFILLSKIGPLKLIT